MVVANVRFEQGVVELSRSHLSNAGINFGHGMATVDERQRTTSTPEQRASDDLAVLVAEGLRDSSLELCTSLASIVLQELKLFNPVSPGARIVILREVLEGTVREVRELAFQQHHEGTYRSASKKPHFQVAAAGELLGLTDDDMFDRHPPRPPLRTVRRVMGSTQGERRQQGRGG